MLDHLRKALPILNGLQDPDTIRHSVRVAGLSVRIGQTVGVDRRLVSDLLIGGLLHDVGKRRISRSILEKPGSLLPEERQAIKEHCVAGVQLLSEIVSDLSDTVVDIVRHHHERLDGSGYPDQLHGQEVSIAVRVVAVADVFDALVSQRPYRPALELDDALGLLRIEGESGRLDTDIITALTKTLRDAPCGWVHPDVMRMLRRSTRLQRRSP